MTYKKLEQLNLKKRLNAGYFFVIALMILSGIISIACFSTLYTNLNHYIHGAQTADTAVKMCRIDVNIAARNIREMALNDDTSTYSDYKQTVVDKLSEVNTRLKTLKETGIVDADVCQEYSDALQKWGEIGYAIIEDIESGDRDAASEKILKQCAPALQDVVTISDKIDDITNAEKEKSSPEQSDYSVFRDPCGHSGYYSCDNHSGRNGKENCKFTCHSCAQDRKSHRRTGERKSPG